MIHSGLSFLLTIYCMYLLYSVYRQRKVAHEYEMMDKQEKKVEGKLCTKYYQSIV